MVLFGALSGWLFGYDTGVVSGAIRFMEKDFELQTYQKEWVVSIVALGAIAGALCASRISDLWGRKLSILNSSLCFFIASIWIGLSSYMWMIIVARFFIGIAIGISSTTAPVYISELVQPKHRGLFVTLYQLAITLGIFSSYSLAYLFVDSYNWRVLFLLPLAPALLQALGLAFFPESPRWLLLKNRDKEAHKACEKLGISTEAIEQEEKEVHQRLVHQVQQESDQKALSFYSHPSLRVGIALIVIQQITGINSVLYYAPIIFRISGLETTASTLIDSMIIGGWNVLITLLALPLYDWWGRRPLLFSGMGGLIVSLVGVGWCLQREMAWGSLFFLMLYVGCFAFSLGPCGWLINSEIHPLHHRGQAMGIVTCCNWLSNFMTTATFLTLEEWLGIQGVFNLYALIGVLGFLLLFRWIPETKGRTLEDIEQWWDKPYVHKTQ